MKKSKMFLFLWAWLAVLLIVPVGDMQVRAGMDLISSDCVREGEWEYYIKEDGTAEIYFLWSNPKEIVVPSELGGRAVTSIASGAFEGNGKARSITLPDTVTNIADSTFSGCWNLQSIILPDSLTSIGERAFAYCESLVSITIPEGIECIGKGMFWNCESLRSVTLPKSIKSIEETAFSCCDSLTSITIPENVTDIAGNAFRMSSNLNEIIVDEGNTVYASKDGVVYNKSGDKILFYPTGRKGTFDVPSDVTDIADSAFIHCEGLSAITIPGSVTRIENEAFYGCTNLQSVTIMENMTRIGKYAFWGCKNLSSIMIPQSVTSIGKEAFFECPRLNNVYYSGSKKKWKKMKIASKNQSLKNAVIYYNSRMIIKLRQPGFTYNGKVQKPRVTVTDTKGQKIEPSMYKVTYKNNKNVGQASITVTGKNKNIGTQTVHFIIYPKGTKITPNSPAKKTVSLKWKKQTKQTDGYEITYSPWNFENTDDTGTEIVTIKNTGTTSYNKVKDWRRKQFYVKIRTYKNVTINGKKQKLYSDWSDVKMVKIEK